MSSESSFGGAIVETIKTIVYALLIAGVFRTLFFQPFWIPSGSMKDTLLIGDFLFVNKMAYGYSYASCPSIRIQRLGIDIDAKDICGWMRDDNSRILGGEPERGDVVVFRHPVTGSDYIKRLIGLPGDTIQMRAGVLYINGKAVPKRRVADFVYRNRFGSVIRVPRYEETLPEGRKYFVLDEDPNGDLDSTIEFKVPPGKYFMMGDNRDDSQDSRKMDVVGFVPYENLVGRAEIIFFSADESSSLLEPWRWPFTIRWGRIFQMVR